MWLDRYYKMKNSLDVSLTHHTLRVPCAYNVTAVMSHCLMEAEDTRNDQQMLSHWEERRRDWMKNGKGHRVQQTWTSWAQPRGLHPIWMLCEQKYWDILLSHLQELFIITSVNSFQSSAEVFFKIFEFVVGISFVINPVEHFRGQVVMLGVKAQL